jgi:Alkaline phosphatase
MKKIIVLLFCVFVSLIGFAQPKKVILMIGDGMGLTQAYSAYTANGGHLNMFSMPYTGFSKTYCADKYITDSGAGATAFSIGKKAPYRAIGLDSAWAVHPNLMELSKKKGLSTAIVTVCDLTHATPAAFVAHVKDRDMQEEIALGYLDCNVDVFIGGGKDRFMKEKRKDGLSLTDSLQQRGYKMAYSLNQMEQITPQKGKLTKLCALLCERHPALAAKRDNMLCRSLDKALSLLSSNRKGFFMMLEGSQIDMQAHDNNLENMIAETQDFDIAVGRAIEYARKDGNTLVIVVADHETGGLSITGGSLKTGKVEGKFSTGRHTAVMVPIYAYGKGAEKFTGVMENTDIFYKITSLLNL